MHHFMAVDCENGFSKLQLIEKDVPARFFIHIMRISLDGPLVLILSMAPKKKEKKVAYISISQ